MITIFKRTLFYMISLFLIVGCGAGTLAWPTNAPKKPGVVAVDATTITTHNIALLLPMQGSLATTSQAIHNGFLAAYYNAREQQPNLNIQVIDTTAGNIVDLYKQAVINGAEMVVGPLTKGDIETLIKAHALTTPTIALNTLDDYPRYAQPSLFQFGLLPQDEAIQVAEKMVKDQRLRAAVIAPSNVWGQKIVAVFKAKYAAAGGNVVAILGYDNSNQLNNQICNFIAADPNTLCVKQKHKDKNKNKKEQVIPAEMRRQDIDSIFVISQPNQGRQIIPLLKFYYAGDLPTYSISAIYSNSKQQNLEQDIDGVIFCDMPWVIQDQNKFSPELQSIYKQIVGTWGESFAANPRLYALGVDALNLAVNFNKLIYSGKDGILGASGMLFLDQYNHIYRQLDWAQMQNGIATALD